MADNRGQVLSLGVLPDDLHVRHHHCTVAIYTAYNLLWANVLFKITTGKVVDPGIIAGNTVMGIIALFLLAAALVLVWDGWKAMQALRAAKPASRPRYGQSLRQGLRTEC